MDDSLSFESFLTGAGKAAYKAMEDHGRGEYDEFALHAGVAVERLAKAALVKRNPIYLVEMRNGNSDLLLYFGGDLELDGDKVRTVGAKEALQRLRRLKVLPPDTQLDKLIELRNGTAHTTGGDEAKTLLPTLAETMAVLLKDVDFPTEQFWGRWMSIINVAVDKQRDAIQRDVEVRIKGARHLFEDRFKNLPEGTKEQALSALQPFGQAFGVIRGDDIAVTLIILLPCPACQGTAQVKITVEDTEEDVAICSDRFYCHWCGLRLDTSEEVAAASIEVEKYLPTSSKDMTAVPTQAASTGRLRIERPFEI